MTFESYDIREIKFKYASEEDSIKIEKFVREFIENLDILKIVNSLNEQHFKNDDYDYKKMFYTILLANKYGVGNIYWEIDVFCRDNGIDETKPAIRNTLSEILKKIYNEYYFKFHQKMDDKLVSIFEKDPEEYKKNYRFLRNRLTREAKDRCEWMLMNDKYNL